MTKFEQLKQLTIQIGKLKPWKTLWDTELIVAATKTENYFCSIMGHDQLCFGISIYPGIEGFMDFHSLLDNPFPTPDEFHLANITCWTCYFYDSDNVDWEHLDQYDGHEGNDLYFRFVSLEKRFYPFPVSEQEIDILVEVFELLLKALQELLVQHSIEAQWEQYRYLVVNENEMGFESIPVKDITIEDNILVGDEYIEELSNHKRSNEELYIDLMYMNFPLYDEQELYEKPVNPLAFYILDGNLDMLHIEFVPIEDDEVIFSFECITDFIEEFGIPESIHCRNPYIRMAVYDLCEKLNIEFIYDSFPDVQAQLDYIN
ncbi:DUF7309 domain-containing protein [Floccifex sp.]|uniref:DUF7309 domain-containing protein n=1 Tax=Floccifex sp. TaxID=2815810 RepID=UPI003F0B4105